MQQQQLREEGQKGRRKKSGQISRLVYRTWSLTVRHTHKNTEHERERERVADGRQTAKTMGNKGDTKNEIFDPLTVSSVPSRHSFPQSCLSLSHIRATVCAADHWLSRPE